MMVIVLSRVRPVVPGIMGLNDRQAKKYWGGPKVSRMPGIVLRVPWKPGLVAQSHPQDNLATW